MTSSPQTMPQVTEAEPFSDEELAAIKAFALGGPTAIAPDCIWGTPYSRDYLRLLATITHREAKATERERERCAGIAEAHQYRRTAKIHRNPFATDEQHQGTVASIRDEERGERIAAVEIAKTIRVPQQQEKTRG